jgi:hypothetical protein
MNESVCSNEPGFSKVIKDDQIDPTQTADARDDQAREGHHVLVVSRQTHDAIVQRRGIREAFHDSQARTVKGRRT